MIKRLTLALVALLLGALLQTAAFAQTPQIRDVTGSCIDDEPRVLKARMLPMLAPTGVRIIRVYATFARDHWPGRDQAHRVTAVFDQASREWRANPVAGAARRGDSLFVQWEVFYRRLAINQPQQTEVATGANTVGFGPPDLAIYAPRPMARVNETRREYTRQLRDGFPDGPYRLAGWAYAQTQRDVRRRPSLRCVPAKHWFVHEAGFHLNNGGFLPTPPVRETVRGETRVVVMADTANAVALGITPSGPVWHPRIWDLHMWIGRGPECRNLSCPTVIQIASPSFIDGLPTPGNTFFQSQTFE